VPDARVVVLASVAFFALGTGGLLFDPRHLDALWAVLLGCGQGSAISLALMMMVLRSRNASEATALSGMAQGIGYLIAAIGPTLVGALYDVDHSWTLPLAVLLGLLVPLGVAGYMAARNRHVEVAS
jgi:CP family cyanate transporter-like MFS transporter